MDSFEVRCFDGSDDYRGEGRMSVTVGHPAITHIVFVGPFGVGKSTAVRVLSDIAVVSTEAMSTPVARWGSESDKVSTTVGIDYGEWTDDSGRRVALMGTPGQSRFSAIRRSVMAAQAGVVLWLYGDRPDLDRQLAEWLPILRRDGCTTNVMVALTRLGDKDLEVVLRCTDLLADLGQELPVVRADPRRQSDVAAVVGALLRGGGMTVRGEP